MVDKNTRPIRLWHGGAPGRRVGDLILPPDITGLKRTLADETRDQGIAGVAQRRDRIYVTTRRDVAKAFAGKWPNPLTGGLGYGSLYQVEVQGDLNPDDDLLSLEGFFEADQAIVLSVYDVSVRFDQRYNRLFDRIKAEHAAAKRLRVAAESGTEIRE